MSGYRVLMLVGIVGLLILGSGAVFAAGGRETADSSGAERREPARVTVGAEARVSSVPDIARLTVGVRSADTSLERATAANNARVAAVIAALTDLGIADQDLQTIGYSVYLREPSENRFPENANEEEHGEYRVSNSVRVTIREIDRVGEAISTATRAGANQVGGIRLEIEDPAPLTAEARRKAMLSARIKAEQLAASEGLRLGRVLNIAEHDRHTGQPVLRTAEMAVDSVPVIPGELSYSVQVSVGYELLPLD